MQPAAERPPVPASAPTPTPGPATPTPVKLPGPPTDTLGYAGATTDPVPPSSGGNVLPMSTQAVPERWRIGWPRWDRYARQSSWDDILQNQSGGDSPYTLGNPLNPYDRNVLKGDYPIIGDDIFLNITGVSDTFFLAGKKPTPSGVSALNGGSFNFFGDGDFHLVNQTFLLNFELFKGYAAYRPVDWLIKITPAFNINYTHVSEKNVVRVNPDDGNDRTDEFATLQEAFVEYHLGDTSPNFDIAALKVGRQLFVSDFRGFIYSDVADGIRLFGNAAANRIQYNLYFANQDEVDTNSGLNELNWRDQQVLIANLYLQDFLVPGYTSQWSFHWNHDSSDNRYDDNGFLVRPEPIGDFVKHDVNAYYLGWAGDGHIGRVNINHAAYYVFGTDDHNPLAGASQNISAYMAALELSIDVDWLRPKISGYYASGDNDPTNGTATGFDAIVDNPSFAGGASSYFVNNGLGIVNTRLSSPVSLNNNFRASKTEGQSNFVNPGTMLLNAGLDMELTPKLRCSINANAIWMAETGSTEYILNQPGINNYLGEEANVFFQYRPWLNNNIIFTLGGSTFFPGQGFEDIYQNNDMLWQFYTGVTLTY